MSNKIFDKVLLVLMGFVLVILIGAFVTATLRDTQQPKPSCQVVLETLPAPQTTQQLHDEIDALLADQQGCINAKVLRRVAHDLANQKEGAQP